MRGALQIDLRLNLLSEIIIRDQLVCLIPQPVICRYTLNLQVDTELFDNVVHSERRIDPGPDGDSLSCRDIIRRH